MLEKNFDISFISSLALREKQIQQNYRPIIAVHKWFARRPGTLFRGLILSEYGTQPLKSAFFSSNNFQGITIADPFMGGGTPLIEANRVGCNVIGYDINPMSWWIVNREIEHLDLQTYRSAASNLIKKLEEKLGNLYSTHCIRCGSDKAQVKYFVWVKQNRCQYCGTIFDLFPNYLLAEDRRHPLNVIICPSCGELNEVNDRKNPGLCAVCATKLQMEGNAKRNRSRCPNCDRVSTYPNSDAGAPKHRMFAIEYHCLACKQNHIGRFFKRPDAADIGRYNEACRLKSIMKMHFVPDDLIPPGDEASRLLRWGYRYYRELFNERQLLGLELSCQIIRREQDDTVKNALITNLSDLLRYQNMLCRYDTMALKSLDIFSVHGFPVGLIHCESNILGITTASGITVGSGGWSNIIAKYMKAKQYCATPFETSHNGSRKVRIPIRSEWIGESNNGEPSRTVRIYCDSATKTELPPDSLDGVFTDPPYFGNVQYAELMDFCYVWLRKLANETISAFASQTTRHRDELTANVTMKRGMVVFTKGLSTVFRKMNSALKPGRPFVFTYHHNNFEAYHPIAVAILDAGLTCSAAFPCPAEMGSSIHINGSGSSIVDTVFVCRSTGFIACKTLVHEKREFALIVNEDLKKLQQGGLRPTYGDTRCIIFGHLVRMAVWSLRKNWNAMLSTAQKLRVVASHLTSLPSLREIDDAMKNSDLTSQNTVNEIRAEYKFNVEELSF